jgi:membrane protein
MLPKNTRLGQLLIETMKSWFEHRAGSKGAALAFYTLFSLPPITMLTISIVSVVIGTESGVNEITAQLRGLIGEQGAQTILSLLQTKPPPALGLVATIVAGTILLFSTTSLFAELKDSLDDLWGIRSSPGAALMEFLNTRILSFVLVLFLGSLALLSIIASTAVALVTTYAGAAWSDAAILAATSTTALISFATTNTLFAVVYKILPNAPLSWRDAWIGGFFTAALFGVGKFLINLYLTQSDMALSFGAAGSLVALLLWVYYSAQIFLLGAIFTKQYAMYFGSLRSAEIRLRDVQ